MNFKEFIVKLQNLPENRKKIILWTVVIVLGFVMGFFWIREVASGLSKMGEQVDSIKLPEISVPNMPSLDILKTVTPTNK